MSSTRKPKPRPAPDVENIAVVPAPAPSDDDALVRAAAAAHHAEALHVQHAQRAQIGMPEPELSPEHRHAVDAHVDAIPEISDHKRRFLKSHPTLLTEAYQASMAHAYRLALAAGVPDDTAAMDHAILAGVARDVQHHQALTAAHGAPAPLQHEAPPIPAPPPPQRRSIPMSAPVSRDVPSMSGGRVSDSNTLSPKEREIARLSRRDLPPGEAELLYLRNRKKLNRMKADGSYSERRE